MPSAFSLLSSIADELADLRVPWVFCGGWAIDLFLDRVTRPHKDVDIAVRRCDQRAVQEYFVARGWQLDVAHAGQLTPWLPGEEISLPRHGVWASRPEIGPEFMEILLNEAAESLFQFRRDTSIGLDFEAAFTRAGSGLPILAPEIVLLYKAQHPDETESAHDFAVALPHLTVRQCDWLHTGLERLYPGHVWSERLRTVG